MKGVSTTKFCKHTGDPKHSGNFSPMTVHYNSLKCKDYRVRLCDGILIVGEKTPLSDLMPYAVVELALTDPYFDIYKERGQKTVGVKKYDACKTLRRMANVRSYMKISCDFLFTYREEIYTDGDFNYIFPEY